MKTANLDSLPYNKNTYDYIICNAVLHFAETEEHFKNMMNELQRVLKPNGTLFIRMASILGIKKLVKKKNNQYLLPDGTYRFLLTNDLICFIESKFSFKEALKTVNVNNLRCMSTLVLKKKV